MGEESFLKITADWKHLALQAGRMCTHVLGNLPPTPLVAPYVFFWLFAFLTHVCACVGVSL